jgi:hypothetical protein
MEVASLVHELGVAFDVGANVGAVSAVAVSVLA